MRNPRVLALSVSLLTLSLSCGSKTRTTIRHLDDAKDAKIGVMTGTTGESLAKARFAQAEIKSFYDIMDGVSALKSGQLDGVVTSYSTAIQVARKNRDLRAISEPLGLEDTSVALRKGSGKLLAEVDRIIAGLKADGTLSQMKKRWFKEDSSPYEEPNIDVPTEGAPLRIGVSATREPVNFVDAAGRITGYDGELARILAARLHRPIQFVNMKFMALIPALQSGKIDMIVSGMTATNERRQFVDFSQPYFDNSQVMIVRNDGQAAQNGDTRPLASTSEIAEKKIGVLLGSAHDTYATKTYPKAKVLQYRTAADLSLAVKTGKVDVALYDEEPLRDMLKDDPSLGILGESLFSFSVGVGFNKKSDELRDNFNRFLAGIKRNGVYADMVERWIKKRETRMPDIPRPQTATAMVAGVSTGGAPFTFVQNNQLLGFDIELLNRFAAFTGKEVKFSRHGVRRSDRGSFLRQSRSDRRIHLHHRRTAKANQLLRPILRNGQSGLCPEE